MVLSQLTIKLFKLQDKDTIQYALLNQWQDDVCNKYCLMYEAKRTVLIWKYYISIVYIHNLSRYWNIK